MSENVKSLCRYGEQCYHYDCEYSHPPSRQKCSHAAKCVDVECQLLHPRDRPKLCQFGMTCRRSGCRFLHPSRVEEISNSLSTSLNMKGKEERNTRIRGFSFFL
jgi:hypothetical protein